MKDVARLELKDLRPISNPEFELARKICEILRRVEASRPEFIERYHVDPSIAMPAGDWTEQVNNPIRKLFRKVIDADYEVINQVRLHSYIFSGRPLSDYLDPKKIPGPDHWVRRYVRMIRHLPPELVNKPPKVLGELGFDVSGTVVSHDTAQNQERVNLMYEAGVIPWLQKRAQAGKRLNILEIGAGYGGLAYSLKKLFPTANYFICDLPESLLFSALYLAITSPEFRWKVFEGESSESLSEDLGGFTFIPNYMVWDLLTAGVSVDLAVNTGSFPEMSQAQVCWYAELLTKLLGREGVLFEQNFNLSHRNLLNCKDHLAKFFVARKTIKPNLFAKAWWGVPDLWANREIDEIIAPSFRPLSTLSWQVWGGLRRSVWSVGSALYRVAKPLVGQFKSVKAFVDDHR